MGSTLDAAFLDNLAAFNGRLFPAGMVTLQQG
jgi:hypothetical protein